MKLLKNAQHECNELKTKYKQCVISLKRSQLDSDRFSTNIELLKVKNCALEGENKELSEQNVYLEERYNKQLIESMKTIKDLEDELQMIQELKGEASKVKKVSATSKINNVMDENEKLKAQISELINEKNTLQKIFDDSQVQTKEYVTEIRDLKSQVC